MSKPTIAQLTATIAALKADHARAIAEQARVIKQQSDALAERIARVEVLEQQLATAKPVRPTYVAPKPTAEQLAYRAALAAARELAMRTGKSVRVGA